MGQPPSCPLPLTLCLHAPTYGCMRQSNPSHTHSLWSVWPARERSTALGVMMQLASMGVICFLTLSRIMGKIFCTNASSCCLNSRAGYLASMGLKPPAVGRKHKATKTR